MFASIQGDTENPIPVFPGSRFLLLHVRVAPVVTSSGPLFSTSTRLLGVWWIGSVSDKEITPGTHNCWKLSFICFCWLRMCLCSGVSTSVCSTDVFHEPLLLSLFDWHQTYAILSGWISLVEGAGGGRDHIREKALPKMMYLGNLKLMKWEEGKDKIRIREVRIHPTKLFR